MNTIGRDEAFNLLKKYNKDPFHIQHALTVEAIMKWYANELGYGESPFSSRRAHRSYLGSSFNASVQEHKGYGAEIPQKEI